MTERYYSILLRDPVSGQDHELLQVPSVTTIEQMRSKPALMHWGHKLGREGKTIKNELDSSSARGVAVHDLVPDLALGFEPGVPPVEIEGWANALTAWWKKYSPKAIRWEFPVCSLEYRYAGRVDLFARLTWAATTTREGRSRCLVDFKTVDSAEKFKKYPSGYTGHKAQLVAYGKAMEELGERVEDLMLCRLAPDGTFHEYFIPYEQWDGLFHSFLRMRDEFHFEKAMLNGKGS